MGVWLRVSCRCFRTQLGLGHSKAPQRPEAAVQAAAGRWPRPQFPPPSPHKLTLLIAPCWPPGAGGLHQGSQAGASTDPDSSWEGATWRREDREDSISEHVPRTSPPGFGRGVPTAGQGTLSPRRARALVQPSLLTPGPAPALQVGIGLWEGREEALMSKGRAWKTRSGGARAGPGPASRGGCAGGDRNRGLSLLHPQRTPLWPRSAVGAPSVTSLFRPHPEASFTCEVGRPFTQPEPPVLSRRR